MEPEPKADPDQGFKKTFSMTKQVNNILRFGSKVITMYYMLEEAYRIHLFTIYENHEMF